MLPREISKTAVTKCLVNPAFWKECQFINCIQVPQLRAGGPSGLAGVSGQPHLHPVFSEGSVRSWQ